MDFGAVTQLEDNTIFYLNNFFDAEVALVNLSHVPAKDYPVRLLQNAAAIVIYETIKTS